MPSHNISISNKAWNQLEILKENFGLRYRSELIEDIALGKIQLKEHPGISGPLIQMEFGSKNIPTSVRLENIYKTNNPLLRSITASIYRYAGQLGLCQEDDFDDMIALMKTTLIDTAKIIELINYIKPDYSPASMSTLINWISFNILFEKSDKKNEGKKTGTKHYLSRIDEDFWRIGFTFFRMKNLNPKEFRLLEARFVFQKNYFIIIDYLKNKYGDEYLPENIIQASVSARSVFRALFHEFEDDDVFREYDSQISRSKALETFPPPSKTKKYCELACLDRVTEKEHEEICEILKEASNDLSLDFWIGEFDHLIGHDKGVIQRRNFGEKVSSSRSSQERVLERGRPAYSEKEKKELEGLEEEAGYALIELRKKIDMQYALLDNIGEFDGFIFEEIKSISKLNIFSLLLKRYETESRLISEKMKSESC